MGRFIFLLVFLNYSRKTLCTSPRNIEKTPKVKYINYITLTFIHNYVRVFSKNGYAFSMFDFI